MLKNYLTIALRNLRKHKGYSLINLAGLTIGMVCCILIMLFVQHELSYDRYHANANQLHRLVADRQFSGTVRHQAVTAAPFAQIFPATIPEIQDAVRFMAQRGQILVRTGEKKFFERRFFFADSNVFNLFSFELLRGEATSVLQRPNSVVLTASTAAKYFGSSDPLGQRLRVDESRDYVVTGVMRDVPANSHFSFDFLASFATLPELLGERYLQHPGNASFHTYFLLDSQAEVTQIEAKMADVVRTYAGEQVASSISFRLQPLTSIHLHSNREGEIEANSDITYVYLFSAIALFILLLASFNFVNLSTARSAQRAREVGMRKVLGAARPQLVAQFLGESLVIALLALLLAMLAVELALPFFADLSGIHLQIDYAGNIPYYLVLLGIILAVGLFAGAYPALFLSGFKPIRVLKGKLGSGGRSHTLRRVLVVAQFTISVALIAGTIVIQRQIDYLRSARLGFDREHVLVVPVHDKQLRDNVELLKSRLLEHAAIRSASATSGVPGQPISSILYRVADTGQDEHWTMQTLFVDPDYLPALGIELAEGRNFSREFGSDVDQAFLVNETAVRQFGWQEPLGKQIAWPSDLRRRDDASLVKKGQVVGVVRDFNVTSLHQAIEPVLLQIRPQSYRYLALRLQPEELNETLAHVQGVWQEFSPAYPFEFFFLDESFDRLYQADQRIGRIVAVFSGLAILVACLGLFGLAAFAAEQRTREIGIRKVLGASVPGLAKLLVQEFVLLVLTAAVVGGVVAFFALRQWLQGFAYRVEVSLLMLATAGFLALAIAVLTVSYQAVKTALANPAEVLRAE